MVPRLEVVAALIWEGGRFLICRRPAHKARGLLWEFVGGKVEPGETKEAALLRECREELDITVAVGKICMEVAHTYEDAVVHLTLFHAGIAGGRPRLLEHTDMRWITPAEIPHYPFCPADAEILAKLREGGIRPPPSERRPRTSLPAKGDPALTGGSIQTCCILHP